MAQPSLRSSPVLITAVAYWSSFGDKISSSAAIQVYCLRVGGAALGYIVQVVLAFFLGAASYGIFALAWILTTVIAQLAASGFNETTNRYLPAYLVRQDLARARGFFWLARAFASLASLAATAFGLVVLYLARGVIDTAYYWPLVAALLCVPFATWTHLLEAVSISRGWMIRGLVPTFILRPLLLIGLAGAAIMYFDLPAIADTAVWSLVLACMGIAVLQSWLIHKPLNAELGRGEKRFESREWILSSLLLIMSQGFVILATNIDILMLGMLAAPSDVGVYFAAAKSVAVVSFVSIAVGNAMVRRLSEAIALGEAEAFARTFSNARKLMLWPSIVLGVGVSIASPLFMRAFGPEFTYGAVLVAILMFGVYMQAAAGPLQEALVILGKQRQLAIGTGLSMVLNITLNVALVLWIGVAGAAIASVVAAGFRILFLRRLLPTSISFQEQKDN